MNLDPKTALPSEAAPMHASSAAGLSEAAACITLTGGQTLVRLLLAEHVAAVYGVVGGKMAPLLHTLAQPNVQSRVPYIGVRHEAAASMMAAAVFASTGRMAVALGEMAPGGLNLAAGAGVAFNNNLAALSKIAFNYSGPRL